MWFAVHLKFEQEHVSLPPWYRIAFASLLKEALQQGDPHKALYTYYYGNAKKNIPKPFTFAVQLQVERNIKVEGGVNKLQIGKTAILYVSSNNFEFIITLYNGLHKIQKYNIYGYPFSMTSFSLFPQKECSKRHVFSIFSPIVVRRVRDDKKGMGYVSVQEDDYAQMLKYSIISQCKFLGDSYLLKPEDIVINTTGAFPVKIPHYNKKNPDKPEVIVATDGTIEIEAPQEVMQLLYDNGIGARRSQGFGMLEVVG